MKRDPDDTFLHKKHVVNLAWLVIGAVLSAGLTVPTTILITRRFDADAPPQRVFVVNADTARGQPAIPANVHATSDSLSVDSIRHEMRAIEKRLGPGVWIAHKMTASGGSETDAVTTSLPATVHGDIAGDVSRILASGCPATFEAPGAIVYISTTLRAEANATDYTPLFVRLLSPQPGNAAVQLAEKTVPLAQANVIPVTLPKVRGHYNLEFGVYERSDLDKEYPTFFRRVCDIEVR